MLYPSESSPQSFQWAALMAAKPIAAEGILGNHHHQADKYGVSNAHFIIAPQSIATEDKTANDGLQQIVGEAHATKDAQVMEHAAHTLEGIPSRDYCRDDHQEDDEVVDRCEPRREVAEIDETEGDDDYCRYAEDRVPYL